MTATAGSTHPLSISTARDVVSLLRSVAERHGVASVGFARRRPAVVSAMTHAQLVRRSAHLAHRLVESGLIAGRPVVIGCRDVEHIVTAYLACVLAGAQPLIHHVRVAFDPFDRIVTTLRDRSVQLGAAVPVICESGDALGTALEPSVPVLHVSLDGLDDTTSLDGLPMPVSPHATLHLQSTSGSTGADKAVVVTHHNVLVNVRAIADRLRLVPDDRLVSWAPMYHDMGLVNGLLVPMLAGIHLVLQSPFDFLSSPASLIRLMSETKATLGVMPNFGFDLVARKVKPADIDAADLSAWRVVFNGAEPIDVRTLRRFTKTFAPCGFRPEAITCAYGLAEAPYIVTTEPPELPTAYVRVREDDVARLEKITVARKGRLDETYVDPAAGEIDVVSAGATVDGCAIRIVDEAGRRVDDLVCGEVVISGPAISPGYRERDGSLRAIPADGFATGDVGFLHEGELFLVERVKNIIIRHGENHSAQMIEQQLARALDRSLDEVVVIDSDLLAGGRVTAIVGVGRNDDRTPLIAAARGAQSSLALPVDDIVFTPRGALPRTTSGKKQHLRLRQLLRERGLTVLEHVALTPAVEPVGARVPVAIDLTTIEDTNVARELIENLARARGLRRAIRETDHLANDLGLDSLARIELAASIEERIGLGLSDEQLGAADTVGQLCETLSDMRRRGDAGAPVVSLSTLVQSILGPIPQTDQLVTEQVARRLDIGGRTIVDFGSLNYLGLDQDDDVVASIEPLVRRWGTHPSWTRAVASPLPYHALERGLADLVGAPDVVVFPTISLLHIGVLPILVGTGSIFVDEGAHNSIREAAELARARGATIVPVHRNDPADLDAKLTAANPTQPRIFAINGVYSMPGTLPDFPALMEVVRRHGATAYIDDAHGLGVLGENPRPEQPYGSGGGGVVRYFGLGYENIVYVSGLSKAFSTLAAFVTCRNEAERRLYSTASTLVFGGPIPTASLATGLAGLEVNRRDGDRRRAHIQRLSMRIIEGARRFGLEVENDIGFPALTVIVGDIVQVQEACQVAWEHGILLTPAVFPAMPLERGGLRFSVTATNTDDDVDALLGCLEALAARVTTRHS